MKKIIIECMECNGTGLYKGASELKGAATICSRCKGKGYTEFHYNEFNGRKRREDVDRVYKSSHGFTISSEDENGFEFSKYGCSYEEWLNGAEPKEIEDLYCPYYAHNHGIGNGPLEECSEKFFTWIKDCNHFCEKKECWKKYRAKEKELKELEEKLLEKGYTQEKIDEIKNKAYARSIIQKIENLKNEL